MRPKIRLIELPVHRDARGSLAVAEAGITIPFTVQRLFHIFDLAPRAVRGRHAHREQHQLILMMTGSCHVHTDDGSTQCDYFLGSPSQALYLPPLVWHEISEFSAGAVCAVLMSNLFSEADYVRDYGEFRQLVAREGD